MKAALLFLFTILLAVPPLSAADESTPPDDFLVAENAAWRRVLGTPVFGDFRHATLGSVVAVLADQSLCQIVVDIPPRQKVPLINRKFHRVPLRTALFLLSQDTGLDVDFVYAGKIPQLIRLH